MSFHGSCVRYVVLCGLVILACSVPILVNTHPPLYDYPFYVARMFILSNLSSNPFLAEHYNISSFLIPNIGMELLFLPLTNYFSLTVVFDIFIISMFTLLITGTIFLHYTLFEKISLWPLASGALVINWIFLFGFLTYLLGVGFFLWGLAAWIRLSRQGSALRHLYGAAIASFLLFVHLASFGLYALAIGGFELQRALTSARSCNRGSVIHVAHTLTTASIQFLPAVLLFLLSPDRGAGVMEHGVGGIHYAFFLKAISPIITLTSGNPYSDLLTAATILITSVLILAFGRMNFSIKMITPTIVLVIAYLVLPFILSPASLVDSRVPIAIMFIVVASLDISFKRRTAGIVTIAMISCLITIKSIVLAWDWNKYDSLIEEYLESFQLMKDQSTLFFAAKIKTSSLYEQYYTWRMESPHHAADLATITGRIFVPSVFAQAGQHTISVRDRFRDLKRYQGSDPLWVTDSEDVAQAIEELQRLHEEVSPDRAAYLLLLDRGEAPIPLDQDLPVVASGSGFRLVEIYAPG